MLLLVVILVIGALLAIAGCRTSRSGYKSAPYTVVRSDGDFELRDYPALKLVETGMKDGGSGGSFSRLFRFITGGNDVLINNAVLRPMKSGYEGKDAGATFAESMQVNATGLFLITRAMGDLMAERRQGSIINIGSIQGMIGPDPTIYRGTEMNGWYPDYFFHKGGIVNFTRFIGSYYGAHGIRCNCISAGGFFSNQPEAFVRQYSERTFLGRMAGDADLRGIVVFLASDASSYLTGTNIPVDGGYTAK